MQPLDPRDPGARPTQELRGVLFADISDSSGLYRALGDDGARAVVLSSLNVVRQSVEAAGGRVVDRIGDELFCLFPDAHHTVEAAIALQQAVLGAGANGQIPDSVRFRVGLHHGPVVIDGTGVFGDTVYVAKRVAGLAKSQQILTTQETLDTLPRASSKRFRFIERTRVKGRTDPVDLIEVLWSRDVTVPIGKRGRVDPLLEHEVELRCHGQAIVLDRSRPSVTLGRDTACDLVIEGTTVSRMHVRVERRKSSIVVVDQSTNGTLLNPAGAEGRLLHRDEASLAGCGTLTLGPDDQAPGVDYEVRIVRP